jgi:hypothetical protein
MDDEDGHRRVLYDPAVATTNGSAHISLLKSISVFAKVLKLKAEMFVGAVKKLRILYESNKKL